MHLHGFEPQEGSIKEFACFCECLESLLEDTESKPHKKTGSSGKENNKKKSGNDHSNRKKKSSRDNVKGNQENSVFVSYMEKIAHTTPTSVVHSSRAQKNIRKSARKMAARSSAQTSKRSTLSWSFPGRQWSCLKQPIKNREKNSTILMISPFPPLA